MGLQYLSWRLGRKTIINKIVFIFSHLVYTCLYTTMNKTGFSLPYSRWSLHCRYPWEHLHAQTLPFDQDNSITNDLMDPGPICVDCLQVDCLHSTVRVELIGGERWWPLSVSNVASPSPHSDRSMYWYLQSTTAGQLYGWTLTRHHNTRTTQNSVTTWSIPGMQTSNARSLPARSPNTSWPADITVKGCVN